MPCFHIRREFHGTHAYERLDPNDMNTAPQVHYHLAYLTANDHPRYQADFLNFRHMARLHPGVPKVAVYIAISAVRLFTANDRCAIDMLLAMCDQCPWLEVKLVAWKGNVGRDFSSAEVCLRAIAGLCVVGLSWLTSRLGVIPGGPLGWTGHCVSPWQLDYVADDCATDAQLSPS